MSQRSVLVTGGAGFIGSHVAERLLESEDTRVVVVDDFNSFYDPTLKHANIATMRRSPRFHAVEADIVGDPELDRLFDEREFDTIVHLAARAGVRPSVEDPMLYQRVNVEGTYRLLELARRHNIGQFVFASSSSVYGARSRVPFRESEPASQPASPYAATKLAGEAACHAYSHLFGIRVVCLRFFTVYGPRQRPDLAIRKFASLMLRGLPIPLFGDGSSARDYTYISDIVDGVLSACAYTNSPYEVINLGNEAPISLLELVRALGEAIGIDPVIRWEEFQPGDVPMTCADISKAAECLGYRPRVRLADGLAHFVEWLKERERFAGP